MARGSNDEWKNSYFTGGSVPSGGTTTEGGSTDSGSVGGYAGGGGIHIKPSHKGLMHKDLGKPAGAKITAADIAEEKTKGPAAKKRAVFAENAKKWHHG
jgi:hypothetical protein